MFKKGWQLEVSKNLTILLSILLMVIPVYGQNDKEQKIQKLETQIDRLFEEVQKLKKYRESQQNEIKTYKEEVDIVKEKYRSVVKKDSENIFLTDNLDIGGYGDIHANFKEGSDADKFDFHRLVLYLGYDFSDWIQFHSEWEL